MERALASVGLALMLTGCLLYDGGNGRGNRAEAIRACEHKAERNGFRVRDIIEAERLNENRWEVDMRVEKRNQFRRLECTYNDRDNEAHLG